MNIIDLETKSEGINWELGYVGKVMGGTSGSLSFVLIFGSIGWYVWRIHQSRDERARELNRLEKEGSLPRGTG